MNIELSGVLLLSIMLSAASVTAHDFSSKTILKAYAQTKDQSLVARVLAKLNHRELTQLEKDVLTLQMQGKGDELAPFLTQVQLAKNKIYKKLGLLAVPPLIAVAVGFALDIKAKTPGGAVFACPSAVLTLEIIPALAYVMDLIGMP